jgi:radical SAM superfamily enzyme YgiQ (UPF0313 family)
MVRLKERARRTRGKFAVFFVDDNFAINAKRTKSLLRDIIAAGAELSWVGQISANLLRDPELLDLIAASGGKWIFIGMESLDTANLNSVNKSFNKPAEYAGVLQELARRNIYAITSFIFGLDNDTVGVAARTLDEMRAWPPVLPVFGQITPFPATPLYLRLEREGRLTRPKHWLVFAPFHMAHTPLKMTIPQVQEEVRRAWLEAYSPTATERALESIAAEPAVVRKNNSALRISTIRAIGSDVRLTLRVGRIADVTWAESRRNNVMHLLATRWFYGERIYCGAQRSCVGTSRAIC